MSPAALLHFVHVSDTHLLAPGQIKDFTGISPELALYAEQVLAWPYPTAAAVEVLARQINALPLAVSFVLHTGDVAGESGTDYVSIAHLFSQVRYPVIYVPGNHDDLSGMQCLDQRAIESICEYEINGVQIICMDSSRHGKNHAGQFDDEQLARLDSICGSMDERPLIIAMHHPPLEIGVPWLDALHLDNGEQVHQILLRARHRLRGVFCGHIHHSIDMVRDGILYSSVASAAYQFVAWPGTTQASLDLEADPGFNIVTITRDQAFVRHHRYQITS